MVRNNSLIETTERFYRLFQQSKKLHINAKKQLQQTIVKQGISSSRFVDAETKITRLDDSEFIEVQEGIKLLPLWGDSQQGASGGMIRFAPNVSQKIYYQDVCLFMFIVKGGTI